VADFFEVGRKIMAIDGPLGFYRGFSASLLLSSNGAIQLYLYETFKEKLPASSLYYSLAGTISKVGSSILTYPLMTIKFKLHQEQYACSI
jgi:hypothetical protein